MLPGTPEAGHYICPGDDALMENFGLKTLQINDWGVLDYGQALSRQHQLVAERIQNLRTDLLILVEHPPVVTIGRSGSLKDLRVAKEVLDQKGVSLHRVDRGGRATFHGPGQLVVYPIVKVSDKGLHAFLEGLLGVVADVLQDYHLVPELKKGKPGLWVNGAKIASVGLSVRKKITYHGIALNVSTDPGWFDLIDPCGQKGEKMTSMDHEMNSTVDISNVKKRFVDHFSSRLGYTPGEKANAKPGRRPQWLIQSTADPGVVDRMEKKLDRLNLATVCKSAHCPNQGECFHQGTATFMILGTLCTRRCRFCAVEKGVPHAPDNGEPGRVALAVKELGLTHAVVTSVTRDDLSDGGAGQFASTIRLIRQQCPGVSVEVLVPDFSGHIQSMDTICAARPDVFNHNIETVPRLYAGVRPGAEYRRSLGVLSYASSRGLLVKSGLMLGLGETCDEIKKTLMDLKYAGCVLLTLGQYLAPSKNHVAMVRYVLPEEFDMWAETARTMGFTCVAAGPLVRSSYRAGQMMDAAGTVLNTKPIRKVS
jgi:lipoic acid synthetase